MRDPFLTVPRILGSNHGQIIGAAGDDRKGQNFRGRTRAGGGSRARARRPRLADGDGASAHDAPAAAVGRPRRAHAGHHLGAHAGPHRGRCLYRVDTAEGLVVLAGDTIGPLRDDFERVAAGLEAGSDPVLAASWKTIATWRAARLIAGHVPPFVPTA